MAVGHQLVPTTSTALESPCTLTVSGCLLLRLSASLSVSPTGIMTRLVTTNIWIETLGLATSLVRELEAAIWPMSSNDYGLS